RHLWSVGVGSCRLGAPKRCCVVRASSSTAGAEPDQDADRDGDATLLDQSSKGAVSPHNPSPRPLLRLWLCAGPASADAAFATSVAGFRGREPLASAVLHFSAVFGSSH